MSRGPALRSSPPVVRSKLDKVEAWTEEPAKAAAEALTPAEPQKPVRAPKKAPRAKVAKIEPEAPWKQFMSSQGARRLANFNLPTELDAKLTWAAHKTYGTRTTVLVKALTEFIDRLVKEGV